MSTVAELMKILEQLPADAEVSVMTSESTTYDGEITSFETLDVTPMFPEIEGVERLSTEHIDISDCTNNSLMKAEDRKIYVRIGGSE